MFDGYDDYNYDNMTFKKNNWMHYGSTMNEGESMWMLSPGACSDGANSVWDARNNGRVGTSFAFAPFSVFPSVYLNSNVEITSDSGTSSDPYILK